MNEFLQRDLHEIDGKNTFSGFREGIEGDVKGDQDLWDLILL